jgi:predicted PurR-regulated permease PerM
MTVDGLNRAAVVTTTVLLALGLVVRVWRGPDAAGPLLDAGLIALMLTPVLRLVTTLAADVRRGDAAAAATTLAVFAILALGLALALRA